MSLWPEMPLELGIRYSMALVMFWRFASSRGPNADQNCGPALHSGSRQRPPAQTRRLRPTPSSGPSAGASTIPLTSASKSATATTPPTARASRVVPSGTFQTAIAATPSDSLTKTKGTLKLKSRSEGPANLHVDPSKVAVGSLGSDHPAATRPLRTMNS